MIVDTIMNVAGSQAKDREDYAYYPRPSMAGPERCIRQMYYSRCGKPKKERDPRFELILDTSSWHEELVADWINKTSFKLHSRQMKVALKDYPIVMDSKKVYYLKGSIDGIITDMMGKERLWENKAINHFTFQRYWNEEMPWDYICQVCIYLAGIKNDQPEIDEALLVIKNKNNDHMLEYLIQYCDDWAFIPWMMHSNKEVKELNILIPFPVQYCADKFRTVESCFHDNIVPPRQYYIDEWRCEYCDYTELCWETYKEEFNQLKIDQAMEEEFATLIHYYLEANMHSKEMEKEADERKKEIVAYLKTHDARVGCAGGYTATITMVEKAGLDKSLIPEKYLEAAATKSFYEKLTIRKPKEKKAKKGDDKDADQ